MTFYKNKEWFKKLKQIVEQSDTRSGRRFDNFIQTLIILSVISFSLETLPGLNEDFAHFLNILDIFTVIIFTIEYLLRIFVASKPFRYIFSFFGLIDLLAIMPFYLPQQIDLRSIRIFRMIKLLRMLKLARYKASVIRFRNAYNSIKEELLIFLTITSFLLFVSSVGIYYFEHEAQPEVFTSVFHSMWYAVITLTTVGYGDMVPITIGGKIFTALMVLVGLGIIAVPTGLISSALTRFKETDNKNSKDQ